MYWNLIWKSSGFVPFGTNLALFGPKSDIPDMQVDAIRWQVSMIVLRFVRLFNCKTLLLAAHETQYGRQYMHVSSSLHGTTCHCTQLATWPNHLSALMTPRPECIIKFVDTFCHKMICDMSIKKWQRQLRQYITLSSSFYLNIFLTVIIESTTYCN